MAKKKGNLTVLITRSCINKTFTNGFTRKREGGEGGQPQLRNCRFIESAEAA